MNISTKLQEQISYLENLQLLATNSCQLELALKISNLIVDIVRLTDEGEYDCEPEKIYPPIPDGNIYKKWTGISEEEPPTFCPDCMREVMMQDISDHSGIKLEIVKRVIAAQDEVLDMDEDDTPSPLN